MQKPFWMPDLPVIIASFLMFMLMLLLISLLFFPMPMSEQAGALLTTIAGVIIAKVGTMVDFFFGSSKASKEKDDTISKMATATTNGKPPEGH